MPTPLPRHWAPLLLLWLSIHCAHAAQRSDWLDGAAVGSAATATGRRLTAAPSLPLDTITLPTGFSISLWTPATFPARFMALGKADDNGTVVFVSSTTSVVTALIDRLDGSEVEACTLLSGQDNPNGIAYDATTESLYVAEVRAITRYDNVDAAALAGCDASLLTSTQIAGPDVLPAQASHANRALGIGPTDGKLYFTVGAPFNVDVCVDPYCSIHRINKDGSGAEVFARGIRNAAGWDWHPGTGALLWAGMERDEMGNDLPDDVLAASYPDQPAVNWAWPYCHWVGQGDPEQREPGPGTLITDPDVFPANGQGVRPSEQELLQRCQETAPPPVQALGPHVAPLGVLYWPAEDEVPAGASTGATQQQQEEWPEEYAGSVFVGEHGSWNRPGAPIGYRIANVQLSDNGTESEGHTVFAEGWLQPNGEAWGRPVGLLRLPDGSMLLADDKAGVVYRISYGGANAPTGSTGAVPSPPPNSASRAPYVWLLELLLAAAACLLMHTHV